jgi:hypothetical protein
MSTVYLIVEGANPTELDARIELLKIAYLEKHVRGQDRPDDDEHIRGMQRNNNKTKAFTGTARASIEDISDLSDSRPWLTITTGQTWMQHPEWEIL